MNREREAVNITLSESLRQAQIKPRLATLAQITGLSPTQIAGRSLTLGLEIIERDLSRVFPGSPVSTSASHTAPALTNPMPPVGSACVTNQPGEAMQRMNTTQPECAHPAEPSPAAARRDPSAGPVRAKAKRAATRAQECQPGEVTTREAARSLGYRAPSGFTQHVQRHAALKRCGRKDGRAWVWDLGKLRAEYERNGWAPK